MRPCGFYTANRVHPSTLRRRRPCCYRHRSSLDRVTANDPLIVAVLKSRRVIVSRSTTSSAIRGFLPGRKRFFQISLMCAIPCERSPAVIRLTCVRQLRGKFVWSRGCPAFGSRSSRPSKSGQTSSGTHGSRRRSERTHSSLCAITAASPDPHSIVFKTMKVLVHLLRRTTT